MNLSLFRREYRSWFAIIGGVASGVSLISLIQRFFRIGVVHILFEFLQYYRRIAYFIIDGFVQPFHLHLPLWYKDLVSLSFYTTMLYIRSYAYAWNTSMSINNDQHIPNNLVSIIKRVIYKIAIIYVLRTIAAVYLSFSLFGLFMFYITILLAMMGSVRDDGLPGEVEANNAFHGQAWRFYGVMKVTSILAAIAYFALNVGLL